MGQNVVNVEYVTDYTPNKVFLRLHMDLPVPAEQAVHLRALLEKDDLKAAQELLISVNPDLQNIALLEAAFNELACIHKKADPVLIKKAI